MTVDDVLTAQADWERTHQRPCQRVYLSVALASGLNRQGGPQVSDTTRAVDPPVAWVVDRRLSGEAFCFE